MLSRGLVRRLSKEGLRGLRVVKSVRVSGVMGVRVSRQGVMVVRIGKG